MRKKPCAARSSASSHEAERNSPDSRTRGSVSRTWPRAFLVLKAHLPRVFLLAVSKYSAPGPVLSKIPVPAPGGRGCAGPLALRYLSAGTAAPLYRGRGDEPDRKSTRL